MIESVLDVLVMLAVGVLGFLLGYGVGSTRSYRTCKKNDPQVWDGGTAQEVSISVMDNQGGPVYPTATQRTYLMRGGTAYPI